MRTLQAALGVLRAVTVPSLRHHRLRTALTLLGIVIGTQVVIAIRLVNRSVVDSFGRTAETIAGRAAFQLSNGSAGVPESLVERLSAVPGVASATALSHGSFTTSAGELTVFGVDLFADQQIRETQFPRAHVHIKDALAFANAPDSIALSSSFLARAGLSLGAALVLTGPTGSHALRVRGVLDPVGPAALYGGAIGLVDLPTAQRLLASGDRVDQIDIALREGVKPEVIARALADVASGAGTLVSPRAHGANLGAMLEGVETILTLAGLTAIIVGMFLVYLTMQAAILERRRDLALARALGFRREAVALAVLLEALLFGAVGALLGTMLGVGGARASLRAVEQAVAAIYARADAGAAELTGFDVLVGLGLGVASALAAVVVPAHNAARLPITEQLASMSAAPLPALTRARSALWGMVVVLGGLCVLCLDVRQPGVQARIVLIMSAVALTTIGYAWLAPSVLRAALRPVVPLACRLPGAAAGLAVERIGRDPVRSRGALAAIMVAFALVLLVGAFVHSLRGTILGWIDRCVAADLYVGASAQLPLPAGPTLAGEVEALVRGVPGVAETNATRMVNVPFRGRMVVLKTNSARAFGRMQHPVLASAGADYEQQFARGAGVFVSDNLAYRFRIQAGERLALDTAGGRREFLVSAVVSDYTSDLGTIIMERDVYRALWRDDLLNALLVWAAPGQDLQRLRSAIRSRLGDRFPLTVLTAREFGAGVSSTLDRALLLSYATALVAMLVAVIAVSTYFLAEIVSRRREIGLLRSVALDGAQLVRSVLVEACVLGVVGGLLAVAYAWPVSFLVTTRTTRLVSGWSLGFRFPVGLALLTVVAAALTAIAGAYLPARRAGRHVIAELVAGE